MSDNLPTYTRAQVAEHNTKKDGWFIVHNDVVNVSSFYDDHPGGRDIILQHLGTDATEAFDGNNHSKSALKLLQKLVIGHLPPEERAKVYSLEDIKNKNTREAAWFAIHNKVYDVTEFLDQHPGGRDILIWNSGKDATKAFEDNNHSSAAKKLLSKYVIGDLDPKDHSHYESEAQKAAKAASGLGSVDGSSLPSAFSKAGDESILSRLQEQLKLFMIIGVFILAGVLLLS